jgi:hypothetical protein
MISPYPTMLRFLAQKIVIAACVLHVLGAQTLLAALPVEFVELSGELKTCADLLLKSAATQFIEGDSTAKAWAGDSRNLVKLLTRSGVTPDQANSTYKALLQLKRAQDPIIDAALQGILSPPSDWDDVVLCVISGGCRIKIGAAFSLYSDGFRYTIELPPSASAQIKSNEQTQSSDMSMPAPPRITRRPILVVINAENPRLLAHLPESTSTQTAIVLIHEFSHVADLHFFERWIEANLKLIKKGQAPDRLFQAYARPSKSLKLAALSYSFYWIFTESRAYHAQDFAQTYLLKNSFRSTSTQNTTVQVAFRALSRLRYRADVQNTMASLGIDEGNFLSAGMALKKEMDLTIKRARSTPFIGLTPF